jgi:hypothetical protein
MPTRKKMMVDVDSTLYDADALFSRVAIDQGHDWYPKKSYEWFRADHIGVSQEVMTNLFRKAHSSEYVNAQLKPYKGAVKILKSFHENYSDLFKIYYVSSRHPQMAGTLRSWLVSKEFPLERGNEFVVATMDKKSWIKKNKPAIVIDDRVQTIIYSRFEIGATVLSLVHNHNRNLQNEVDGVFMCQDWFEIGSKLDDILEEDYGAKISRTPDLLNTATG